MSEMVKYTVEFELKVLPADQDLLLVVPDIIMNRFQGTALRISRVTVTNEDAVVIGPDNPRLAAAIETKQKETT